VELDRIKPSVRPPRSAAGTQRWRELLFMHWSVPIEAVRAYVPESLELDSWDGRAWIGVVPFRMEQIRPSWLPRTFGLDFLELNLRTYVHYRGEPGVWFFSLEASSRLAVHAARAGWSLPYWHASMRTARQEDRIAFTSLRGAGNAWLDVEYEIGEPIGPSVPGTFEHFLLERYLLFSNHRGRILEGQVHHPPYLAHHARVLRLEQTLTRASGLPALTRTPEIAHWSPGVDVEVFGPWPASA
jgi:uncharacterized protein YqjF (DUF2071 family)